MMKVSLILEAVNRVTAPMRAVVASLDGVKRAAASVAGSVSASFGRIGGAAGALRGRMMAMNDFVVDAGHHFRRLAGEEGMARAARSAAYLREQVSGLTTGLSILKYASVAAAIGLGEEFVRGVFTAGGESQRMLVTLTRLEGSATKAKRAMEWMTTFGMGPGAAFSMPDIMRSYQQAKNFGMNPQGGSLASFADLAAGERVPLKQVLLAVKDAMEGTSTRPLANLGIKMKQGHGADGINTYLYSNLAGKWVTEHSAKTPEAVLETLVRIINGKYMGLATAQAKTVPGGIEQLKKLLYNFQMKVANAGVLDWALSRMNQFFGWVRKASADGTLDRLAKRISGFLTGTGDKIIAFVRTTDWHAVARDLLTLAKACVVLAGALAALARIAGGLSGLLHLYLAIRLFGIIRAFWGFRAVIVAAIQVVGGLIAALGWPVVLAIAGLIALFFAIRNHWAAISAFVRRTWSAVPGAIMAAWRPLSAFFKGLWDRLPAPPEWLRTLGGWVGGAWNRLSTSIGTSAWAQMLAPKAPQPGPPRPRSDAWAGARTTRVGGTMTIEFANPPPGMRVTQLKSAHPDVAIALKRGPVLTSR